MKKNLQTTLDTLGIRPYLNESSYPINDAQRNLAGRTHYVDDDTMRYFKARINHASGYDDGLTYAILESVAHPSLGRVHRPVIFDVFGTVICKRDNYYKTSDQARKAMYAILNAHDAVAHTWVVIGERYNSMVRDLALLGGCLTSEVTE